ncbi:1-acyl-sn-glycerol-3-phosphate acyltransferase PLS1 isoform X1 [Ipomoea triloba]|uniref:1-acyl-sn-glycerol-3-phosphate acyltransferase PLS1 isoform X1 n=1 Tax=Ipomoea triloba TaxID=35885 RepID=UPI00125D7DBE|nr:1-acyl-sn-glycerol-3-phosphate acyltransferase PLS1 isoform X1 [Ipomoea triloba]
MAIATVVILPLGLLFIISGLTVNVFQALLFVLVRPISKSIYRRINKEVTELLWMQFVWLFDWWANIKVELYIDPETYELLGKENAVIISNHRSDIDWLVEFILAQRAGCLGNTLALAKKPLFYIPILGWSMWFAGFIVIEGNWAKDERKLQSGFKELNDFQKPFWLVVFLEGTRFTRENLLAAQEYAASAGLPVPKNVLIPRTKGFVTTVSHLRTFVPAIYDLTVAIPKTEEQPTMLRIFRRHSSVVHVHIQRHLMQDLPESGSGISQWCKDVFVEKDALLEQHLAIGKFTDKQCHDIGRPRKSLLVFVVWSCLVLLGIVAFFVWCPLSWGEAALCAVFLVVAMIFMRVLILTSQSDCSSTFKAAFKRNNGECLLPR